ncbi:nuclear GTPase SLIP-GC-like [Seriola lalandi dorsalis]|uniref:nuclear GTPase SLIP-GC-like n=1 Tax=Seriola lalandi dorsalis TaxID=1841481 RepID=UPI000C6F51C6|nr:nuclear GTPase SLIP-GC-like [Seriola lalandi dorsalis]
MDEFVRNKLTEWGLSMLIERFEDEGIDTESLYCLGDQEIDALIIKVGPKAKFRKRLKLLKAEQNPTHQETVNSSAHEHEEAADSAQSTSDRRDKEKNQKGKRKLDLQGKSTRFQSPASKRQCDNKLASYSEEIILSDVKKTMNYVHMRLQNEDNTRFNAFLKNKICDLETDKRELVGVFGKTGAGKSSLINAVIGVRNLLPSGSVSACTSVMIKVEANKNNSKCEADIEFITKEEWKDELWSVYHILRDADQEKEDDDDYRDTVEKLSALYGEEWQNIPPENLMDNKYFREIPEFLISKRKILTCESAEELSAKFVKYTRSDSKVGQSGKRWYWPLVKCVTVRVPDNDLLQHVTLVDLPGNGDRNKSRDKMWKEIVGSCSTVWIVTDINRAASEKEPWEILQDAISLMGNGGECQRIHFICTKSDLIEDSDDQSAAGDYALILKRNMEAKETVMTEFRKQTKIKKHFSDEYFKVFTVSSKEFLKNKRLRRDDTEIPKLQEFLQDLNDCHSVTLNYVSGAYGILSLIQGARCREVACKKIDACTDLEENMKKELDEVTKAIEESYKTFEKCLTEGVEKAKSSCEGNLKSVLYSKSGRGFHKILKCVVENNGTYKPKKTQRKEINLNEKLSSCLTDSIDEEFRKTFPNQQKCGPFKGAIIAFSLDTEKLMQKYKEVELQLTFLHTEEEKIKMKLNKKIREHKKTIYSSLTGTIEAKMHECYKKAAEFSGQGSLEKMRETIKTHVHESKNTMFDQAKAHMLMQLNKLKENILVELEKTLKKSIELSLKTDDYSIPDVAAELDLVKTHYNEVSSSPDEEMSLLGSDPPGPSAAPSL